MKVALLYPEVYDMARFREQRKEFPPFGVLYLAAVIENAGHETAILKVTPSRTELDLSAFDAVGFSLSSSATYGIMAEARRRSTIRTDALVMVGGVHCNFYPVESLRDFGADVATDGLDRPSGWLGGGDLALRRPCRTWRAHGRSAYGTVLGCLRPLASSLGEGWADGSAEAGFRT